jgi:hypothetical protein
MPKFIAQRTIRHGNSRGKVSEYQAGTVIELSDEEAKQSLESGAVVPFTESPEGTQGE